MTTVFRTLTIFYYLSIAFALPPNPKPLSLVTLDPDSIVNTSNATTSTPLTTDSILCLEKHNPPDLDPPDCGFVLNVIILQQSNVLRPRIFKHNSYATDDGTYVQSRWQYRSCEIQVYGDRHASQLMSLLDVALAADRIVRKCVDDFAYPIGGLSLIGDESKGFNVILRGYDERVSATNSSLSQSPAISVSKRAMRSRSNLENSADSQRVESNDQPRDLSLTLVHPAGALNSTFSVTAAWDHPVHCFDARVTAGFSDCSHITIQIYRLFNPLVKTTFGFTDAADINLSRPEYQKWQYGQCVVSLENLDEAQLDTFRFIDVIVTAGRINQKCVVDGWETPQGGTASVGALESGFYVYLGAPLAPGSVSSDSTLSRRNTGTEGIQR